MLSVEHCNLAEQLSSALANLKITWGKRRIASAAVWALLAINSSGAFAGTILVTPEEASLPAQQVVASARGILRAPSIEFVAPDGIAQSPIRFVLKFQAYGDAKINTDSVQFTYLKTPEIDLVPRVRRFLQRSGIMIDDAEIPPGHHQFRASIADTEGRTKTIVFEITIQR